jgi:hypothetical protein
MLYRLKTKLRKSRFNRACRRILDTPAIGESSDGPVMLSEVSNFDVIMYLVAVKSLYAAIGKARIVLLLDRDCPQENLRIFEEHVRPWKILHVEDQVSDHCPRGGTWERLLTIAQLVTSDYVIQVDSDTVTNGPVPEVVNCVGTDCSFMIGTWEGQEIEPVAASAERVKDSHSQHVQILGERRLTALDDASRLRYARGQSSFAGFARGSFSLPMLEAFSERMRGLLGEEKWSQWGSESFASNFCVANADKSRVLPWPKYASYNPERDVDFSKSAFLHFEGTNRFKGGAYLESGKGVIDRLSSGRSGSG